MASVGPASPVSSRDALLDSILSLSFHRGRFQLASGAWSDFYLDLRRTTLDARGLTAATNVLWPVVEQAGVHAVGGPTLGADPLVAGLLIEGARRGTDLRGFLVRGAPKDHGTERLIEGHCPPGTRVAILDDVITRGGSFLRALEAVREAGALPVLALALVDREEGGSAALAGEGIPLFSVFRVPEILDEAARRGL